MGVDHRASAVVAASIGLARALDLETVAEGVETRALLGTTRDGGCDLLQGFHIARPMPGPDLSPWLSQWNATRLAASRL